MDSSDDSDYLLGVSDDDSTESEQDEDFESEKRRSLVTGRRKESSLEALKNSITKSTASKQQSITSTKPVCTKRKIAVKREQPTSTPNQEDSFNSSTNSNSFQLMNNSHQSFDETNTSNASSIPTTPTMELDVNASMLMPAPSEEPPYFMEKFPGKLCALCNLGERSQLGQGEMLRMENNEDSSTIPSSALFSSTEEDNKNVGSLSDLYKNQRSSSTGFQPLGNKRQKGLNKCKNPVNATEYVDELEKIGHLESFDMSMLIENTFYYIHRSCAMWSSGVTRDPIKDTLSNVTKVVQKSLNRKCSYCNRYGASVTCNMTCPKVFHFACVAASGGFQVFQNNSSFCKDHLGQVPLVCSEDIDCKTCSALGDVGNLMMCSLCGNHYHGACIGVAQQPGVRAGWQCQSCKVCQICKIPDTTEGRSVSCETCDKIYHAQCLRPVMTTIPKYGWKCRCCRVCSDCGARTPGAGASSRWHNHFSVCDSCYQQRNKGYSCPICRRAYRAAAQREMVKCNLCQKYVHSSCDADADLATYESRKESNPDYEYVCSHCKTVAQNDRIAAVMRRSNSADEDSLSASQESLNVEEMDIDCIDSKPCNDFGLGKGKPFVASKIAKKRLGISSVGGGSGGQRPKGVGKLAFQKRPRFAEFGRKRGPKSKMRGIFGVPGVGLQRPVADSSKQVEEEPGNDNRLVLCSAKDRFILTQDICVMCGATGTDQEGCLIACAQCGQCYHPYCVSVKVTKVILQKGWRCLDCTVCEGCGQKNDEARLLLCDDCDISYHIYCMEPPLDNVPHGTWKCKWCANCLKCGANDPGTNCSWMNSYTECGPCASHTNCATCNDTYSDGELIIQCTHCDRWLHCACDSIKNEADAEKCAEEGYSCNLCRPKDLEPPHLRTKKKLSAIQQAATLSKDDSFDEIECTISLSLEGSHFVEGVYLSEHGLQQIKSLQTEPKRAKRKPKSTVEIEKDAAILAAIESVVAGSAESSLEEVKLEPLDPNEEAQIYKDGMLWSSTDPAPEGFSLFTTDTGTVVLRKKRQRNLQKLGIGGFSVRNRAVRSTSIKNDEEPSNLIATSCNEENKNKKKPQRRKQKSKLIETYPAYLQEAFFGRPLLDSNVTVKLESSSSEDETITNVTDDKTIKLSLDELKMIETMRAKQHMKIVEEQKLLQSKSMNETTVSQHILMTGGQIQINQKNNPTTPVLQIAHSSNSIQLIQQPDIKLELNLMDEDGNNSDTEAFKDVLLPSDLLDNDDLVNTIMNEDDDEMTKNSGVLDDSEMRVKDELTDILNSPHFNVDEIFKNVLTDESQESQESMMTNSMTSYSTQSTPSHQSESQQMHSNQTGSTGSILNQMQQSPQHVPNLLSNNSNLPMMSNMSNNNMNLQSQTSQNNMHPQIGMPQQQQQQQQQQMGPQGQMGQQLQLQQNILQRQNSVGLGNQQQQQQQAPMQPRGNPFNSSGGFPNQAQWNTSSESDFDISGSSMNSAPASTSKANNNQKTAERMGEDEKLGEQSTISSVLYANQNHPELKIEFPHWPDRYKQVLKKWRALSTEKKAPYLQRARDNRSAQQAQIRTKKVQQVVPDLSPDGGTSSSAAPSPALSTTLSDSSSLIEVGVQQQQQQQQPQQHHQAIPQIMPQLQQQQQLQLPLTQQNQQQQQQQQQQLPTQQIQVDQDKVSAQQKSMREAEQERQWKQLQAIRAREQQLGIPPDPQRMQDPNVQLQISTSLNDGSMSPIASPSPNSRNQFIAPTNKGRIMINPQSPSSNFQHPGRPVSVQLQQQQQRQQQRLNQSPFSPQGQTSQSPHDLYPGSPSTPGDSFARPSSEDQFLHSPQSGGPRSIGQPSPGHTPGGPNRSPAYGQLNQPQQPVRPLDNVYVQSPGTPRPSFSSGTPRTTVYARPDMFNNPPFGSPRSDTFANVPQQQQQQQQSPQEQNNRQLRDLLQRQQAPANNMPSSPFMDSENPSSILSPKQPNMPAQLVQQQQQQQNPLLNSPNILQGQQQQQQMQVQMGQQQMNQQQQQQSPSQVSQIQGNDNTFRQPLPPGMSRQPRLQLGVNSMVGGNVMIRQSLGPQIPNQRGILISSDNRTRLSIRPGVGGGIINPQQQQMLNVQQQQQNQLGMQNQQRMPLNQNYGNQIQNDMMQHGGQQQQQQQPGMNDQQNMSLLQQRMTSGQQIVIQQSIAGGQMTNQRSGNVTGDENSQGSQLNQNVGDAEGIPDSVTAELEKLEQDENAVMGEVDILGGLGDDDDDLLDSLTAEMGADFNILEYADPELDTTDDEKTNLLDSLELDESEITKEEKLKVAELEKNKAQFIAGGNRTIVGDINQHQVIGQQQQQQQQQQILLNRPMSMQSNVIQNQLGGNQMQPIVDQTQQLQQQNSGPLQQQQQQQQILGQQQQQAPHIQQNQQILLNNQQQMTQQQQQQGGNFQQRQQIRIKAPEIQQIHQQMMLQLQQAAANGKPMQIGTRLVANNNITGIVVGANNIQLMFPQQIQQQQQQQQRLQQLRMVNPNIIQGQQNPGGRMTLQHNLPQNRLNTIPAQQQQQQQQQQTQQQNQLNPSIQGMQTQITNQTMVTQQQSAQQSAVLPPPPYSEPPPPYPGQSQEQPLLLEDLLEQEKREQARHTNVTNPMEGSAQNQSLLSDQDYEKLRPDVLSSTSQQNVQHTQISQQQQQQPLQNIQQPLPNLLNDPMKQQQFLPRAGVANKQWRPQVPLQVPVPMSSNETVVRSVPLFQANLHAAPPVPPETVNNEADKQAQIVYELWLNQQNVSLQEQLSYYETEILELRKLKKSLNTKQRQLKKSGNELTDSDAKTLAKVSQEQSVTQKHLESARKQARQHLAVKQDYEAKQKSKQMVNNPHMAASPIGQMAPQSPLMSPSPGIINQSMMQQQSVQSPLHGNSIMQPSQSPLLSPSPMMPSQSPGPASVNSILQSPGGHINNAMSPYNSMQPSPRIGTPHSQNEDNPFSPNAGSLDGSRLTSPSPRMTSPQHRPNAPMLNRMVSNPGQQFIAQNQGGQMQFNQQQQQQQQSRFVRPQMIPNDPNNRMRIGNNFQPLQMQNHQQQNIIVRQNHYSNVQQMDPNNNPQQQQQQQVGQNQNMDALQNQQQQRVLQIAQQRQLLQRQQLLNQQGNQMQQQQQQQQHLNMQQQPIGQQQQQQLQLNQNQMQMQVNPNQIQMQQQQQQQQQQLNQNQLQQMNQYSKQSPIHQQPPSPLLNQNVTSPITQMPRSPMVHYQQQQQQNPSSPMMGGGGGVGGSPGQMRRPPSTGLNDRPLSVESSPRSSYMQQYQHSMEQQQIQNQQNPNQQQQQQQQQQQMNMGGGGGGGGMNMAPHPPFGVFGSIKLGLRGGAPPMWNNGRGKQANPSEILQIIQKQQAQQAQQQQQTLQNQIAASAQGAAAVQGAVAKAVVATDTVNVTKVFASKSSSAELIQLIQKKQLQNQASTSKSDVTKMPPRAKVSLLKNSPISISNTKIKSLVSADYNELDDSSNTPPISPINQTQKFQKAQDVIKKVQAIAMGTVTAVTDDIVIVDSSPDEKLRLLDYDDDNEKVTTLTELSLNSTAQDIGDSDIETFDSCETELVSSPLDTKGTEYVLFDSHVVIEDSNESLKDMMNSNIFEDAPPPIKEVPKVVQLSPIASPSVVKKVASPVKILESGVVVEVEKAEDVGKKGKQEDFEAMIDCGSSKEEEIEPEVEAVKVEEEKLGDVTEREARLKAFKEKLKEFKFIPNKNTISLAGDAKTIVYSTASSPVTLSLPVSAISRSNITTTISSAAVAAAHKKLANKNSTQTTAKVSIGNTTISVPVVMKNMPMQQQKSGDSPQNSKKLNMTNNPLTMANLKKNPGMFNVGGQKINTSTIVTLSLNRNNMVQTVHRVQKPGHTQSILVPISTCVATSSSSTPSVITNIENKQQSTVKINTGNQRSASQLSFAKISALLVTQDTSLPTKIFEDDSISPDSSIETDDVEMLPETILKKDGSEEKDGSEKDVTMSGTDSSFVVEDVVIPEVESIISKKSTIPVHVIIKSRESSPKPTQGQRLMSTANVAQQLSSPLSQPIEINTNTANATQQIRSIMSSINDNKSEKDGGVKVVLTSTPTTATSSLTQAKSTNAKQFQLERVSPAPITSSGNILLVKQIRTTPSPHGMNAITSSSDSGFTKSQQIFISATKSSNVNPTIVVVSQAQMQQPGIGSLVTKSQMPSNLLSILSSPGGQQQTLTRIINYSDLQQNVIQTSTALTPMIAPTTTSSTSSGILNATLSQPSMNKTSPAFANLLNATNAFKRSKSTDDASIVKEVATSVASHHTKRLSLEASNIVKLEPIEKMSVIEEKTQQMTSSSTTTIKTEVIKSSSVISPPPPSKPEDSQNVLLKQLLQNSGTGQSGNSSPMSRPVPGLITNQRAPSLGVFSSLEAQLARPIVPPAPANSNMLTHPPMTSIPSSPTSMDIVTKNTTNNTVKLVTRETSFVSKPSAMTPSSSPSHSQQQQTTATTTNTVSPTFVDKHAIVVLNRNDVPANLLQFKSTTQKGPSREQQQQQQLQPIIDSSSPFCSSSGMAPPNIAIKKETIVPLSSPIINKATTVVLQQQQPQQQQQLQQQQQQNTMFQQQQQSPLTPTTTQQSSNLQLVKSISQTSLCSGTTSQPTTPVPMESPSMEMKKEIMDDSSQSESISSDISMVKMENIVTTPTSQRDDGMSEAMDTNDMSHKTPQEIANELKKKKRREYQKNRRQMQTSKEKSGNKKPRKVPKTEEDYDSFIDNLMVQIKSLPQMQILEPLLPKNFGVCPIYGCTDLNKLNASKRYNVSCGELLGTYTEAELPYISDFYNTEPFGCVEPKPEQPPVSNQRGFYDQEFPPIKFEEDDHHHQRNKYELHMKDRDIDTPDTIVGSSSPECVTAAPASYFPGLKLIQEDEDEDEMKSMVCSRMSPSIPIITPIPIRLKAGMSLTADNCLVNDKENESKKEFGIKSRFGPPTPFKDNSNVTVTLTLTSSAAEDIMGVLKALANILHIPAPTTYNIVERTTTPPSQKLGLYRTRGKDGKEGQPVDIQTILNGSAKFCRHCDVVILNNIIRAKASEFPLLVNTELEAEDLYFCGKPCYKQFQWRPIDMLNEKSLNSSADDKSRETLVENLKVDSQLEDLLKAKDTGSAKTEYEKKSRKIDEVEEKTTEKKQKLMIYKNFSVTSFPTQHKVKKLTEREITEMLFRMNITVSSVSKVMDDSRKCIFCHQIGDGVADGPSRLLNYDVDKWVHLNCALWSDGVYETVNGALMNIENTLQLSLTSQCSNCNNMGATIKCFKARCGSIYHLSCAMKDNCVFYKNKTTMCQIHAPKSEKDNELTTLSVQRRVYIDRDESRQVASIMHHSDLTNLMRVGSLILLNVGQLLPHQLQSFHTPNYIYPIGFKIIRFFWSMRHPNRRCRYICSIADAFGRPEFRILVKEAAEEDIELRDASPKSVWQRILDPIAQLRKENNLVQVFPKYVTGEDLFGLTEPSVVKILESLPGVETLTDYRFKYGRNPLLELPLAINPSGSARTEPRLKNNVPWKKPHTQRTGSSSQRPTFVPSTSAGEVACPYSKQFVHSKSSQYKKMKLEWRNNVFLARSKIQGLGLYAARDLEKHTMVIEYIGEVIRGELSELREKQYEAKNRGIYMFRLDEDRVIDATLSGGLARYINHSCNPNCTTEIVEVDREYRIIIFAKRRINRGEELSYDYKFDIEDESHKIQCACGASNCKKFMN